MAYYKQILAVVLICLSFLYNYRIQGLKFVKVEGGQNEAKEGRSIDESRRSGIISSLFSDLIDELPSDYHIHHAGCFTPSHMFEGTRARISVWGIPNVSYNSESAVFIAVLNENGTRSYSMVAGFHVYPSLYSGSTDLRLFAGWTKEKDGMGCYSTDCQGFVLSNISGAPVPGGMITPLSTVDGKDYFVTLSIKKDEKTQDWSLYRDDNSNPILIGWWPKTLFNNTFDYATKIVWAGGVMYPKNETSPPMGSGHAAGEGENKAAYISHIKLFDQFGQTVDPDEFQVKEITDRYDCFTTDGFKYSHGKGYNFYYGGPAGCKN